MEIFTEFTDLILSLNPKIAEKIDAQPVERRVLMVSKSYLIGSKRAAGSKVDLADFSLLEIDGDEWRENQF